MEIVTTIAIHMNDCQSDNFVSHMDPRFTSKMDFDYRKIPGEKGGPKFFELGAVYDNKIGKAI